ncbi:MAG: 5-bromo-4-chloroindolyl phosphate hydrolysis family protein [Eubacteriales bacterium]|nr:5-bromo-4-chloroindolyl phosphate hydrolysis family protein [Eubacteriales bacterium]
MSNGNKKRKGKRTSAVSFGITFIVLASIFNIHGIIGLGIILALSSFVSKIFGTMAQGLDLSTKEQRRKQEEEARQAAQREAEERAREEERRKQDSLEKIKGNTGNSEVDTLLNKGREMIMEIREENAKIPDESLTNKLNQLEKLCSELFQAVYEKPAKASQIRKFMDYYLPTTLKMVKSYRILGQRSLKSSEMEQARLRIDDALGVVITGCQKLLTNLYKDDVLDITTDIDVLEQMLKRDGLTESDLELAAEQAKQAAKLDMAAQAAVEQRKQAAQAAAAQAQKVNTAATAQSAPIPAWQQDSGVRSEVDNAQTQAAQHIPQVPTLSGEMYPSFGGQAMAQAPQQEKES